MRSPKDLVETGASQMNGWPAFKPLNLTFGWWLSGLTAAVLSFDLVSILFSFHLAKITSRLADWLLRGWTVVLFHEFILENIRAFDCCFLLFCSVVVRFFLVVCFSDLGIIKRVSEKRSWNPIKRYHPHEKEQGSKTSRERWHAIQHLLSLSDNVPPPPSAHPPLPPTSLNLTATPTYQLQ